MRELRFEPATRTALALTRAWTLERYDGRWHRLANLRALGFGKHVSFQPLAGGLIGVLRGASRRGPAPGWHSVRVGALPRTRPVLLGRRPERARRRRLREHGRVRRHAREQRLRAGRARSLYVLRRGDGEPTQVYDGGLRFAVCERWADLDWHGGWLLYATTEGKTIAIDTRAPALSIDLTPLVTRFASKDGEGKVTPMSTGQTEATGDTRGPDPATARCRLGGRRCRSPAGVGRRIVRTPDRASAQTAPPSRSGSRPPDRAATPRSSPTAAASPSREAATYACSRSTAASPESPRYYPTAQALCWSWHQPDRDCRRANLTARRLLRPLTSLQR